MNSSKPYLISALYEWIVDNDCTPYVVVNAYSDGVEVPVEFVKDGQIVLNIGPSAVGQFNMSKEGIFFSARFGGIPREIYVPSHAILGVYAKENGKGMMFEAEDDPLPPEPPTPAKRTGPSLVTSGAKDKPKRSDEKPSLRVIK